ncbi:hypothetical protein C8R47DRAFT_4175 [Mycena vitilis]|nr:hypothetical protein C8R47DRAFT_4175 [Mycena vitilis]
MHGLSSSSSWGAPRTAVGVMENGWTRYQSCDALGASFCLSCNFPWISEIWLSQANYIFTCRGNTTDLEAYGVVNVRFIVQVQQTTDDLPPLYLFLCPVKNFRAGPSSCRWPECPAYWSLDPSEIERLSTEQSTRLGFPQIELKTELRFVHWDRSVYAGLRQFHQAKGFNPDKQDLARHLGYPLYRPTGEEDDPYPHGQSTMSRRTIEPIR